MNTCVILNINSVNHTLFYILYISKGWLSDTKNAKKKKFGSSTGCE